MLGSGSCWGWREGKLVHRKKDQKDLPKIKAYVKGIIDSIVGRMIKLVDVQVEAEGLDRNLQGRRYSVPFILDTLSVRFSSCSKSSSQTMRARPSVCTFSKQ